MVVHLILALRRCDSAPARHCHHTWCYSISNRDTTPPEGSAAAAAAVAAARTTTTAETGAVGKTTRVFPSSKGVEQKRCGKQTNHKTGLAELVTRLAATEVVTVDRWRPIRTDHHRRHHHHHHHHHRCRHGSGFVSVSTDGLTVRNGNRFFFCRPRLCVVVFFPAAPPSFCRRADNTTHVRGEGDRKNLKKTREKSRSPCSQGVARSLQEIFTVR